MLLKQLGAKSAAFYFVERENIAYHGTRDLLAIIARWLTPGDPFAPLPDVLPLWGGSYLPFEDAQRRWAFPDIHVVRVGCRDADLRARLVKHVTSSPPLGMFDHDLDADGLDLPLVFLGVAVPNAVIRNGEVGRRTDHATGLDVIGFDSDEAQAAFEYSINSSDEDFDGTTPALLRVLASRVGRRLGSAQATDGFDPLLNQAFEQFGLGSVSASGAVAGVAFEQLMRAALTGEFRAWLKARDDAGDHTALATIIDRYGKQSGLDTTRLHRYRELRNDFAHRLGDEKTTLRTPEELWHAVDELLRWLEAQEVDSEGVAALARVEPDPATDYADLLAEALSAGDAAAEAAPLTMMQVGEEQVEPQGFAWVIVRDRRREFTRWLNDQDSSRVDAAGARMEAPGRALERNLAWAHAVATRLRSAGHVCDYGGAPD